MLAVAVDDTDSREGGCTTHLVNRIVEAFPDCVIRGLPRLVRLNPNVPWKTRGNAAVAVVLDETPRALTPTEALERVASIVRAHAYLDATGTQPGIAVSESLVHEEMYWRTVREIVPREDAVAALNAAGAVSRGFNGGRGLVGCAAALAWRPERSDHTFELIAYRARDRWGTPRAVTDASVRAVAAVPGTFDSYDDVENEVVMVPASPCPVLWGLRGDRADTLARGLGLLGPEKAAGSTVFITNQGTDDHLVGARVRDVRERSSHVLAGTVATVPATGLGGHVFFTIRDGEDHLRAAAYAPTLSFRDTVRALEPGDEVTVAGGVLRGPDGVLTLNLEKLEIRRLVARVAKVPNPICPLCERAMRSAGSQGPYRCRRCGTRAPKESAFISAGTHLEPRWYEVPARARRHLAKPLSRVGSEKNGNDRRAVPPLT